MTATKPKSTSQQCSSPGASLKRTNSNTQAVQKRARGPINKRACQRCRQGKIKCDGDAETGKPCSNCDPQACKFDNSPRKNKQVEQLKQRMGLLEDQLGNILKDVDEKLTIKNLEMEIVCQLWELKELFDGSEVSTKLVNVVRHSKLPKQLLVFTRELLQRVSEDHEKIPKIINSLQQVVDCAEFKDPTVLPDIPTVEQYRNVNGEYELVQPSYDPSILIADSPVIMTDNSANLSSPYDVISCLNSHSPSEDGSETLSGEYGSGSPPTPNEQHSLDGDSETYHQNSSRSSSQVSASPISGFYYNANPYYSSDYIDYNATVNPYYYEATNTTSPTDGFLV